MNSKQKPSTMLIWGLSSLLLLLLASTVKAGDESVSVKLAPYMVEQRLSRDLETRLTSSRGNLFQWLVVSVTLSSEEQNKPQEAAFDNLPGFPSRGMGAKGEVSISELLASVKEVRVELGVPDDLPASAKRGLTKVIEQHFRSLGSRIVVKTRFSEIPQLGRVEKEKSGDKASVAANAPPAPDYGNVLRDMLASLKSLVNATANSSGFGEAVKELTPLFNKGVAAVVFSLLAAACGIIFMLWRTSSRLYAIQNALALGSSPTQQPMSPQLAQTSANPRLPAASESHGDHSAERLRHELTKDPRLSADIAAFVAGGGRYDLLQVLLAEASPELRRTIVEERLSAEEIKNLQAAVRSQVEGGAQPLSQSVLQRELLELLMLGLIDSRGLLSAQIRGYLKAMPDAELAKHLGGASPRAKIVLAGLAGSSRLAWLIGSGHWTPTDWPHGAESTEPSESELAALAKRFGGTAKRQDDGWQDFSSHVVRHLPIRIAGNLPQDMAESLLKYKQILNQHMDQVTQRTASWSIDDVADLLGGFDDEQRKSYVARLPELRRRQVLARKLVYSQRSGALQVKLFAELEIGRASPVVEVRSDAA